MTQAWHITGSVLRDGTTLPEDGVTLRMDAAPIPLHRGYHACRDPLDALMYASGTTICRVRLGGEIVKNGDKLAAQERTILWRVDGDDLLRRFARRCALDVIDLWDAPDVVVEYLRTGDEKLRDAAREAARATARAAAWDAAWDAADWDAAWAAALDAARAADWDAALEAAWSAALAAAWSTWSDALDAARAADWDAARAAALDADWDAAQCAARAKQRNRLTGMIYAARRGQQ